MGLRVLTGNQPGQTKKTGDADSDPLPYKTNRPKPYLTPVGMVY